jgi:hypothetical protein
MANRRAQIAQNIRPGGARNGGTTAPPSAARGATTGIGGGQVAPNPGRVGRAQGLGAPPQPGAPAPVQPQPAAAPVLPWDVGAANDEAGALKQLNGSLAGLGSQRLLAAQEYGLEGPWADYASNPYSRSALLQRSYDNAKRGTRNSAGRGIYAGSYINAQNQNTHGFDMGRDELQKGYAHIGAELTERELGARNAYQEALSQAAWNRVNTGLASEPEPMPVPGQAPAGGGGKKAVKKPQAAKAFAKRIK